MKNIYDLVNKEDWILHAFDRIETFAMRYLWYPRYQPLTKPAYYAFIHDIKK